MISFRSENIEVEVHAPPSVAATELLTPDALRFIGYLCNKFDARRRALLALRKTRALSYDAGDVPKFISDEHPASKDPSWRCATVPKDVQDRRVEITGPVDRKMIINGLNSGACVYMADLEDSTSPTWENVIEGQLNLRDAINRTITYVNPTNGKVYSLNAQTSILFVRPRGWHLDEGHVTVNGKVASGSIFDFALYLFHNANRLLQKETGPYYYLPKLENHMEAALWNDIFVAAQTYMGLPIGTIRATVLLETIVAAYEMEEILYELKDHSLGLNCGRWDYLFSFIKKFKDHSDKLAPDRSHLTMTTPLMDAYVKRLIFVCHRRGTFAMGGMSASIPIKNDPRANEIAMNKVKEGTHFIVKRDSYRYCWVSHPVVCNADKLREVTAGHDGTWVAHPALVKVAKEVFDQHMKTPNQINSNPGSVGASVTEQDLLRLPVVPASQAITGAGLEKGIKIVMAYSEAWLRGIGCIPLHNAMEDAATAEISRAQIWQWRRQGASTRDDGRLITLERITAIIKEEVTRQGETKGKWRLAGALVEKMLSGPELDDFLTSVCYPYILTTAYEGTPPAKL